MENSFFKEIHYRFGFGCMRLPMKGSEVDLEETNRMVDEFLSQGFNYFDTAHGYIDGKSELAIRECLVKRYPREDFLLVDKLTDSFFKKEEDIRPFFESQLEACGVEYFDFYLMHAQNAANFKKYKECHAYETAFRLKEEGKIRHVGISFHDKAEVLEQILTEYPQVEAVQLQFNYVDYDDPAIEGRRCYEICEQHGKPVIVMEPVKGGSLVNLSADAQEILDRLDGECSNAGYALRYAASFPQIMMVLSGMSNLEQMQDNLSYMRDFHPLDEKEMEAVARVCQVFRSKGLIPCTACHYCVEDSHCPKQIRIPELFADMNAKKIYQDWNSDWYYMVHTQDGGKASDCIGCGKCEKVCPQHLGIRELLSEVAAQFG